MGELIITILGGRRPRLLERTLCSVERHSRSLLEKACVVALINGGDGESARLVKKRSWVDELLEVGPELIPIGAAVSRLWEASDVSGATYLMHLEDDWECSRPWFEPARTILERDGRIGQVRLRRDVPQSAVGHAVMRYHMVTGKPLKWEEKSLEGMRYRRSRAHLTFNPALIRADLVSVVTPCESELDCARRFHGTGLEVAQWLPGAFGHIGGEQSLRERTAHRGE